MGAARRNTFAFIPTIGKRFGKSRGKFKFLRRAAGFGGEACECGRRRARRSGRKGNFRERAGVSGRNGVDRGHKRGGRARGEAEGGKRRRARNKEARGFEKNFRQDEAAVGGEARQKDGQACGPCQPRRNPPVSGEGFGCGRISGHGCGAAQKRAGNVQQPARNRPPARGSYKRHERRRPRAGAPLGAAYVRLPFAQRRYAPQTGIGKVLRFALWRRLRAEVAGARGMGAVCVGVDCRPAGGGGGGSHSGGGDGTALPRVSEDWEDTRQRPRRCGRPI